MPICKKTVFCVILPQPHIPPLVVKLWKETSLITFSSVYIFETFPPIQRSLHLWLKTVMWLIKISFRISYIGMNHVQEANRYNGGTVDSEDQGSKL
jgi:hypothetical protein